MAGKFALPTFLEGKVEPARYNRWLKGRTDAHLKRDSKRGHEGLTVTGYKRLIHEAVVASGGFDYYTGEMLDWHLVATYENAASKLGRHAYKKSLGLLPSIDHEDAASTCASFRICAWRTNDAKHDLTQSEFIKLCRRVVRHADGPS
jgi:hypothetical protein